MLGETLRGITGEQIDSPGAFPLAIALFYEPFLCLFALVGVVLLWRRAAFDFVERFLLVWVIVAALVAILYADGKAAHALWLIVPLAGLASYTMTALLIDDDNAGLWGVRISDTEFAWQPIPRWSKWLLMAITVGLLAVVAIHVQSVGQSIMQLVVPEDYTNNVVGFLFTAQNRTLVSEMALIVLGVLFLGVVYLLAASMWGNTTSAQGGALGLAIFALVTSLGSGWHAAVHYAHDPVELWHTEATHPEVFLLRDTLLDVALRESEGFKLMDVTVVEQGGISEDGVVAWVLRDFPNTQFVESVQEAQQARIVLLERQSRPEDEHPALNSDYVGQSFTIGQRWQQPLHASDFVAWWTQRKTRTPAVPTNVVVLWLRQDVYEGLHPDEAIAG
jgi:hypothetical protein